jgi:hypothetical protein
MDEIEDLFGPVISAYPLNQAIADGELVAIFKNRWSELTGGKPLVATRHIYSQFSLAALLEIWNEYVYWSREIEPSLPEEDRLFSTTMNDRKVWVLEDGESFTILFPEDY